MKNEVRDVRGTQLGWNTLARSAGIASAVLLAAAAVGLRDLEAAAMTVGTVVAIGLLRWRSGLFGLIGLALLSANAALWMAPGAISNITHGEGFWETALPSTLSVVAITTLVAVVGALAGLRSSEAGARFVRPVAIATLLMLVIALVVATVGTGARTPLEPGDIRLVSEQVKFSDTTLIATAGTVGVYVENRDLFWHTFTVKELDVNLNVPVGGERRVEFDAAPGTYEFICKIPGHEQTGMKGTLTVR